MFTRRALLKNAFLKGGALSVLTLGGGPAFLHRAALAVPTGGHAEAYGGFPGRRKVLVTLFQRGAMDGLAAVPLLDEPALNKLRPNLAMSAAQTARDKRLLDLDGRFGLHPALTALEPWWRDGRLAVVHAVGSPHTTRSHFDAQDYMESGTPGVKGTASGWLNRVVGELGHEGSPFRAVAMTPALPRALYGPEPSVAVTDLASLQVQPPGGPGAQAEAKNLLQSLYASASEELLRTTAQDAFDAAARLSAMELRSYQPAGGAVYPKSELGDALRQIAMLVKADVGLEVAFAESGGWDTHVRQGTLGGSFAQRARDLAASIAAFWTDLGERRDDVTVMTMTEFGRTVRENGSGGTDHGHGSCLFLLGNGVDGGKVHGTLPSLDPDALFEGRDLPVTTDFRAVFSEVASRHLGVEAPLFPGWNGRSAPLFRS